MSSTEVTLLASFVGVFGALSGLVVERLLRTWGRVRCEPTEWNIDFWREGVDDMGYPQNEKLRSGEEGTAAWVEYSVQFDMFSTKEIPVGLRDISIVFTCDDGEVVSKPLSTTGGQQGDYGGPVTYPTLRIINLSPRQWNFLAVHNTFREPQDVRILMGWRKAELVGQRHSRGLIERKEYRKILAVRESADLRSSAETPSSRPPA